MRDRMANCAVNGESLSFASKLNEMKDNDVVVNNEAEQHCGKKRAAKNCHEIISKAGSPTTATAKQMTAQNERQTLMHSDKIARWISMCAFHLCETINWNDIYNGKVIFFSIEQNVWCCPLFDEKKVTILSRIYDILHAPVHSPRLVCILPNRIDCFFPIHNCSSSI